MTKDLIQNIYSVFSKYTLNDKVTSCYCDLCMTEEYSNYLHGIPLKDLTADALYAYIGCVGITEGGCNDFKYFLPRILELIYNDIERNDISDFYIFIWDVLEKIDYSSWKEDEQNIFVIFFKTYWDKVKQPGEADLIDLTIDNVKAIVLKPHAL